MNEGMRDHRENERAREEVQRRRKNDWENRFFGGMAGGGLFYTAGFMLTPAVCGTPNFFGAFFLGVIGVFVGAYVALATSH